MQTELINQKGKSIGKVDLNPVIFGAKINLNLMAQAVRVYQFNNRRGTVKTKARGEVRGGGIKPWRQKGTGRARHGSRRSPIWVGGGHGHAKIPRDYSLIMPRKMRRKALFSAMSAQLKNNNLLVVDKIGLKKISSREAAQMLKALSGDTKTLIVLPESNPILENSIRNIPSARTRLARMLNTYEILNCAKLVLLKDSIEVMEKTFL
ncbi:50S ribosomal protein L4 [Patescibacteria group bacterium]|nr:50S ribosomal protein L4 [Patescibacteria group bacterium]